MAKSFLVSSLHIDNVGPTSFDDASSHTAECYSIATCSSLLFDINILLTGNYRRGFPILAGISQRPPNDGKEVLASLVPILLTRLQPIATSYHRIISANNQAVHKLEASTKIDVDKILAIVRCSEKKVWTFLFKLLAIPITRVVKAQLGVPKSISIQPK